MAKVFAQIRFIAGALALAFLVAAAAPAPVSAQGGPTAATSEQQLLQQLKGGVIAGQVSIPDKKAANLDTSGRPRLARRSTPSTLHWIGGIAILGMLLLLVVFYLWRGTVRIERGRSGRTIVRFNAFERFVHWLTAVSFVILGDHRPQHHLRPQPCCCRGWARRPSAPGRNGRSISHNYPQLRLHHRRGADVPDVDRRQHAEHGRHRMVQGRRRHVGGHIRRPTSSTPAKS